MPGDSEHGTEKMHLLTWAPLVHHASFFRYDGHLTDEVVSCKVVQSVTGVTCNISMCTNGDVKTLSPCRW